MHIKGTSMLLLETVKLKKEPLAAEAPWIKVLVTTPNDLSLVDP